MRNPLTLLLSVLIGFTLGVGVTWGYFVMHEKTTIEKEKRVKTNVKSEENIGGFPHEKTSVSSKVDSPQTESKSTVRKSVDSQQSTTFEVGENDTLTTDTAIFSFEEEQDDTLMSDETPYDSVYMMNLNNRFPDTLNSDSSFASTSIDTALYLGETNVEDEQGLTIRKEELVAREEVVIQFLQDSTSGETNDTVLSSLSDIREAPPATKVLVEFWESPINYQGYKFGNNRLILFGLEYYPNQIEVGKDSNGYFFHYLSKHYRLTETFEFRSYQVQNKKELEVEKRNE